MWMHSWLCIQLYFLPASQRVQQFRFACPSHWLPSTRICGRAFEKCSKVWLNGLKRRGRGMKNYFHYSTTDGCATLRKRKNNRAFYCKWTMQIMTTGFYIILMASHRHTSNRQESPAADMKYIWILKMGRGGKWKMDLVNYKSRGEINRAESSLTRRLLWRLGNIVWKFMKS